MRLKTHQLELCERLYTWVVASRHGSDRTTLTLPCEDPTIGSAELEQGHDWSEEEKLVTLTCWTM